MCERDRLAVNFLRLAVGMMVLSVCLSMETRAQWSTSPTVNNAICIAPISQTTPQICSDGSGGAIITWADYRNGTDYDIYAQRIDASGTIRWAANGVAISTATGNQSSPAIVADGFGGAIISWSDQRSGTSYDVYAQRINASGVVQWATDGVSICIATGNQFSPSIVTDDSGGAVIVWEDFRNGTDYDIYAQAVNSSGFTKWTTNGIPVDTTTGQQESPSLVSDGAGGAIIAWWDTRNGMDADIYSQWIDGTGTAMWTMNGVAVCMATGDQVGPKVVSDGSSGAIIVWQDGRSLAGYDIYAQRINEVGSALWTTDGVGVSTAVNIQQNPTVFSDDSGGAFIAWEDYRNNIYTSDVYVQKIDGSGVARWVADGVPACPNHSGQFSPIAISDGSGGAIITWMDIRNNGYEYTYAQRFSSSGTMLWNSNGIAVCLATGQKFTPVITGDGIGGAIVSWNDGRSGYHIYAQRLDRLGNLYPAPWITMTGDIGNDQGGKLRILWNPSNLDKWPDTIVISYTVMLGVSTGGVLGKVSSGQRSARVRGGADETLYWEPATTVSADWSSGYSAVVSTSADSGIQGIPWYYFRIVANSSDRQTYWTSNIDSSYSVDNLPPTTPLSPAIVPLSSGPIELHWHRDVVDPDFNHFDVYRSNVAGFVPSSDNRLTRTIDTLCIDSSATAGNSYYYCLTTVDIHGNQSAPTQDLSATALSLQLASFSVAADRLSTALQWTTASQTNEYGFGIQRRYLGSISGSDQSVPADWFDVAFVAASENSTSPKTYTFIDRNVEAGNYAYRLRVVATSGAVSYSPVSDVTVGLAPKKLTLSQNYPNPFNPSTSVEFTLPDNGRAVVEVFDQLGRKVGTLFDRDAVAGEIYKVKFNGAELSSGVYLVRLAVNNRQLVRKMLLMK